MRAIWKGAISFGLVNIPIALFPATRREELRFQLLRKSDLSPINNRRVAANDGKEVPWEDIVKGYEYEKGKFVILKDEDFARVDLEATQTVDIIDFVKTEEVSPIYFHRPYFMEPEKGGDKAYTLLRQALEKSERIGIAKVIIKTRQHLAAVKAQGHGLMLELMHFAKELVDEDEFDMPKSIDLGVKELRMAESLIDSMSSPWEPEKYHDDYREALEAVIEEKLEHPDKAAPKALATRKATKSVDLVAVLQKSLAGFAEAQKKALKEGSRKPSSERLALKAPKESPAKKRAPAKAKTR